jgi:hypothetical protein
MRFVRQTMQSFAQHREAWLIRRLGRWACSRLNVEGFSSSDKSFLEFFIGKVIVSKLVAGASPPSQPANYRRLRYLLSLTLSIHPTKIVTH